MRGGATASSLGRLPIANREGWRRRKIVVKSIIIKSHRLRIIIFTAAFFVIKRISGSTSSVTTSVLLMGTTNNVVASLPTGNNIAAIRLTTVAVDASRRNRAELRRLLRLSDRGVCGKGGSQRGKRCHVTQQQFIQGSEGGQRAEGGGCWGGDEGEHSVAGRCIGIPTAALLQRRTSKSHRRAAAVPNKMSEQKRTVHRRCLVDFSLRHR